MTLLSKGNTSVPNQILIRSIRSWVSPLIVSVAAIIISGCSSLPTINPDMARSNAPIQLESARGTLSAKQSKQILDKLKARGQESSIFDRHLALEEAITDSPLVIGNRTALLRDGPATYKAMFAAINGARDYVLMETYIFEDDDIGKQFSDALIARHAQGVEVALMYDSAGSFSTPREFFQRLIDAGVKVQEFNPVNPLSAKAGWEVDQRDHRKLLIVDGRIAFVGGINISSVYSSGSRPGGSGPSRGAPKKSDGIKDAVPRRLDRAERRGANVAQRRCRAEKRGERSGSCDRQLAHRQVQPHLRDVDLGDQQRRVECVADECVFRT
jgi:cardiolipin synthase